MAKLAESILYVALFLSLGGPNGVFAILPNTGNSKTLLDRTLNSWFVHFDYTTQSDTTQLYRYMGM